MSHGLSPTGAKILDANDDGLVVGHPAALAKLMSDGLVVPHLHAPLAGGMGDQRGQCTRARDEADVREAWWKKAAALHNEHAAR